MSTVKNDMQALAKLDLFAAGTAQRARSVLARHRPAIRASFAALKSLPRFTGRNADDAWEYFAQFVDAFGAAAKRIERETSLRVSVDFFAGKLAMTVGASGTSKNAYLPLATTSRYKLGEPPSNAFFAPLLRPLRATGIDAAAALLQRPHDVKRATSVWGVLFTPRPPSSASVDELIEYLLQRHEQRHATKAELAEMDALAVAAIRRAKLRVRALRGVATAAPRAIERWLVDVDAGLADARIQLTICERRGTLELEPAVLMGDREGGNRIDSAPIAAALYAKLAATGASAELILEAMSRVDRERLERKLDAIVWFRSTLRTKSRRWMKSAKLPKPASVRPKAQRRATSR